MDVTGKSFPMQRCTWQNSPLYWAPPLPSLPRADGAALTFLKKHSEVTMANPIKYMPSLAMSKGKIAGLPANPPCQRNGEVI